MDVHVLREKQILEQLLKSSSILLGEHDEQEVLNRILHEVQVLGFDRVRLYLLSDDGQSMLGKAAVGMENHFVGSQRYVVNDSYMQVLLKEPRLHVFTHEPGKPAPFDEPLELKGVEQWVCVPLMWHGKVIGKLSADNKTSSRPIRNEDLGPLALFASQAAAAIENARLFAETERKAQRLRTVLQVSTAVSSSLKLDQILSTACRAAVEFLKVSHSGLVLFAPDIATGEVRAEYPDHGMMGLTIPLLGVPAEEALLKNRKTLAINDIEQEASLGAVRDLLLKRNIQSILIVPVVSKDKILGSFSLDSIGQKRVFQEEEIELCEVFAAQVAVAIENAQLFEETKRRAEELETLRQTTLTLTSEQDRDRLLGTITRQAIELLYAKSGGIHQYYPERGELEILVDATRPHYVGTIIKLGEGMAGKLVQGNASSMIIEDYAAWQGKVRTDDLPYRALLGIKLQWQDQTVGVLYIADELGRKFSPEEVCLLQLFADQAAVALINVNLIAEDAAKLKRLEKLSQATREIVSNLDSMNLPDRLTLIAAHVVKILGAETASVLLVKQPNFLSLEASYGHVDGRFHKGKTFAIRRGQGTGLTGYIAYEGKIFNAYDDALRNHPAARGPVGTHLPSGTCHSLLALPLKKLARGEETLVGLLRVDNKKDEKGRVLLTSGFTKEDEWILTILAETILVALEAANLVYDLSGQKDNWERLVASSPSGIVVNDEVGRITQSNRRAQEILGYTAEEMLKLPVSDAYVDSHEYQKIGKKLRLAADGRLVDYETLAKSKTGDKIPIRLSAVRLDDTQRQGTAVVGYFEDLRAKKEAEGRETLLRKVSDTVAKAKNLTEALQSLTETMVSILGHTFCRVLLADENNSYFTIEAAYPIPRKERLQWSPGLHRRIEISRWRGLRELLDAGSPAVLRWSDVRVQATLEEFSSQLHLPFIVQSLLLIPLKIDNRLVALIELGEARHETRRSFTKEEEDLASAIAAQTGVLVDRIRLHESTERRKQLLTALDEGSFRLRAELEISKLLQEIVDMIARLVGCRVAGFWGHRSHIQQLQLDAAYSDLKTSLGRRVLNGQGLIGAVAQNGASQIVHNYAVWPDREDALSHYKFDTVIAVPVKHAGATEAVLFAAYGSHYQHVEIDREILERFAARVSNVLLISRLMNWEQRRFRQLTVLQQLSNYIQYELDLGKIVHAVLTGVTAEYGLGFNRVAMFFVDENQRSLVGYMGIGHLMEEKAQTDWDRYYRHEMNDFGKYLNRLLEQGPLQATPVWDNVRALKMPINLDAIDAFSHVIQTQQEILLKPGEIESKLPQMFLDAFDPDPTLSLVLVPLVTQDRVIGVLVADNKFTQSPVEVTDLLRNLLKTAAIAIDYAQRSDKPEVVQERFHAFYEADSGSELRVVLRQIVQGAMEVWQADSAAVWSYDTDQGQFTLEDSVAYGIPSEYWKHAQDLEPEWRSTAQAIFKVGWLGVNEVVRAQGEEILVNSSRQLLQQIGIQSFQGIALSVGREDLGVLYVNYNTPRSFSAEDRELARAFANYAASILKNAKLVDQMHKTKTAIEEVAAVTTRGNLSNTLEAIAQGTKEAVGCDVVTVYTYDQLRGQYDQPPTMIGVYEPEKVTGSRKPLEESFVYKMLNRDERYIVEKVVDDALFKDSRFVKEEHIASCIVMPLKVATQKVGVMFVTYRDPHRFLPDDLMNVELFANQAAVAIRYTQLYEQEQKRAKMLQAVYEAGSAVTRSLELGEILDRIVEQVHQLSASHDGQASFVDIWLVKDKRAHLEKVYPAEAYSLTKERFPSPIDLEVGEQGRIGVIGRVYQTKTSRLVRDTKSDPDYLQCHRETRSELAVPIKNGSEVIGVINVEHSVPNFFTAEDQTTLESLAIQTAIAMQNAYQYEELRQTKGLVGARTALAWMGMVNGVWRHAIDRHAINIRNVLTLMRQDITAWKLDDSSELQASNRIKFIEGQVLKILEKDMTTPLSSEETAGVISINDLLRERLSQLWENELYRGVALHQNFSETYLRVKVNPEWFRQALDILIENSVEAMRESKVRRLTISTQQVEGQVEIAIADTGKGMEPELEARIFKEPIRKPEGSKGFGMGLLMVEAIIQTYRGTIHLDRTGPNGTTFIVLLPLAP